MCFLYIELGAQNAVCRYVLRKRTHGKLDLTTNVPFVNMNLTNSEWCVGGSPIGERGVLGRILSKADSVNGTRTNWRYHYDLAGRLDSVWVNSALSAWYGYDSNGAHVSGTGISGVVVDAQDREISANGITYTYDDNGQLIARSSSSGTTRYHLTPKGELLSVVLPSEDSVAYVLDAARRKIAKSLNGVITNRWLWDGSLRLVAEVDSVGGVLTRYVYATHGNVPDYFIKDNTTYRIITDHLESVRLVVNAQTNEVVSRLDYDIWGNLISSKNKNFQPFGFAGGLRDDISGLTRFGAREYLSETGQWISKDPIGFKGNATNLFSYAGNDPVNFTDQTGQAVDDCSNSEDPTACYENCMNDHFADYAIWGMSLGASAASIPKIGRDATISRGMGGSAWTSPISVAVGWGLLNMSMRQFATRINPVATGLFWFSAS